MSEVLSRFVLSPDVSIPGQVAEHMSERPQEIVVFALYPEDLGKAVREATVFPGVKIEGLESYIKNDRNGENHQLHVNGAVSAFGRQIEFSGVLGNTPSDKIAVLESNPKFGKLSPLGMLLKPAINATDELAKTTLNAQFGGAKIQRLHIGNEALEATVAGSAISH